MLDTEVKPAGRKRGRPAKSDTGVVHDPEGKAKLVAGGKALKRIQAGYKKLWEDWTGEGSVGQALVVASDEALRASGAKERKGKAYSSVFSALLKEYGLSEEDGLDPVTRAALLNLMPILDLVNKWLAENYTEPERQAKNHPRVVWNAWSKPLKDADKLPNKGTGQDNGDDDGQRDDDLPDDDVFGAGAADDDADDEDAEDELDWTEGDDTDGEGDDSNVVTLKPRPRTGDESKATIESLRGENERLKSKVTLRDNRILELEKENKALKVRIRELEGIVLPRTSTGEPVAQTAAKMLSGVLDMSDYQQFEKEQTV